MPIVAQPLTPQEIRYIDVNTNYGENRAAFLIPDIQVINNQLYNLFTTYIGEADYEPEYGSTLPHRLFDLLPGTALLLQNDLFMSVRRWMSDKIAVTPEDVRAIPDYPNRAYVVLVKYVYPEKSITVEYGLRIPLVNQER